MRRRAPTLHLHGVLPGLAGVVDQRGAAAAPAEGWQDLLPAAHPLRPGGRPSRAAGPGPGAPPPRMPRAAAPPREPAVSILESVHIE
eukprot:COSAG01_NODE_2388_length_7779_cov_127.916384_11_plen_87_part_00